MKPMVRKKVNIAKVAEAAGVSKMTVSRMLNDTDRVAPATQAKLQRIIDELDYQPNPFAQGLMTNTSKIIALMIFDSGMPDFFLQMLSGIQYESKVEGYNLLIISNPERHSQSDMRHLRIVDGVLCLLGSQNDISIIEQLDKDNIPYSVIGRRNWKTIDPWFCATDYVKGYREITRHLLDLGHKNVVFIGGSLNYEPDTDKCKGFQQALYEAKIPYNPELRIFHHELERIPSVFKQYRPTAALVEGREANLTLLLYAKNSGISIPERLSVISSMTDLDAYTLYSLTGLHKLTSVMIPLRELGIAGVKFLIKLMNGDRGVPRELLLPVQFIKGESCGPPK
jgi:DNA-binding LacI/PurR family transcriptional regulator